MNNVSETKLLERIAVLEWYWDNLQILLVLSNSSLKISNELKKYFLS